jgi:hypothetical protein
MVGPEKYFGVFVLSQGTVLLGVLSYPQATAKLVSLATTKSSLN